MICPFCLRSCKGELCSKCSKIYIWDKKYKLFRRRGNISKIKYQSQRKLYAVCKLLYGKVFQEVAFPNCYSEKGSLLRFDIYIPDKRILIEYQGDEHYRFIRYFHKTKSAYRSMLRRDFRKKVFCLKHDYIFLEFTQNDNVSCPHEVKEKINDGICAHREKIRSL